MQAWMRHGEAGLVELDVAVDEQIEVDRSWAEARAGPCPTQLPLDFEQPLEERARRQLRVEGHCAVDEVRLVGQADGRGLAERRDARDGDGRSVLGRDAEASDAGLAHAHANGSNGEAVV